MSSSRSTLISDLSNAALEIQTTHLRELLQDDKRNSLLFKSDLLSPCGTTSSSSSSSSSGSGSGSKTPLGIIADLTRQKVTPKILDLLYRFAREGCNLEEKINGMRNCEILNMTENRMVLHCALRIASEEEAQKSGSNTSNKTSFNPYPSDICQDVLKVRNEIKLFSDQVRSASSWLGCTGKPLTNIVCVGIGGSYLGVEFVAEALKKDPYCKKQSEAQGLKRELRFLANVDPIDVSRALDGLDAEKTLVVIVSKTFTTAETMLNAKTVRQWLLKNLKDKSKSQSESQSEADSGSDNAILSKHFVAVSTASTLCRNFGIQKMFGFWDWVGGRFSVTSAVGLLPLSLYFGYDVCEQFLSGARQLDEHFFLSPIEENLPVLLGLISVWNISFLKHRSCAILPYCQALHRFTAHIQQNDMESNGKRVQVNGEPLDLNGSGAVIFGEPGTNSQHSFFQLLHQGSEIVPCEFIGFCESQNAECKVEGEILSNHDELMANFFAQPNAMAMGRFEEEVRSLSSSTLQPENQLDLAPHKTFPGNRPSSVLLFNGSCDPFSVGQILSLYEHRTAVQGWLWNINSFDQWGVELGKVLAKDVVTVMKEHSKCRDSTQDDSGRVCRGEIENRCEGKIQDKLLSEYLKRRKIG